MTQSRLDELLRAGRQIRPPAGSDERIWNAVKHRLVYGPPPAVEAASTGVGGVLSLKVIAGLLLVAAGVGFTLRSGADGSAEPMTPRIAYVEPMDPAPTPTIVGIPAARPAPVAPVVATGRGHGRTASTPGNKSGWRPLSIRTRATDEPIRSTTDDFTSEMRLIAEVRDALTRGDSAGALRKVEEHRQHFGAHAQFVQERLALQAEALCTLGRNAEARKVAATFLARWPDSTHAPLVRAVCSDP